MVKIYGPVKRRNYSELKISFLNFRTFTRKQHLERIAFAVALLTPIKISIYLHPAKGMGGIVRENEPRSATEGKNFLHRAKLFRALRVKEREEEELRSSAEEHMAKVSRVGLAASVRGAAWQ